SPVFRREVGSLDVDLANEIDADVVDLTVVAPRIQVEASVHGEQVGVGAAAIDRLGDAQASGQAELIVITRKYRRAGEKRGQLKIGGAVESQLLHLLLVNDARDLARSGVDRLTGRRHHLDALGNGAGFEREINRQAAVSAQIVAGLGRLLKPLTFDGDAVIADG